MNLRSRDVRALQASDERRTELNSRLQASLVVQPSVSHYREAFVRCLLSDQNVKFRLFGKSRNPSSGSGRDAVKMASKETLSTVHLCRVISVGHFYWEVGIVANALLGASEVHVLEGRIYTVSTWIAALAAKARRKQVLYWGHGWKRSERGAKLMVRKAFYSLADGLVLYGNRAREFAISQGWPPSKLYVVYNSLYSQAELGAASVSVEENRCLRDELRLTPDAPTLILSCRLTQRHGVDLLLDAISQLRAESIEINLVVIGDGSERERLERHSEAAGLRVAFLGAIYELEELRRLYAVADVAVSPGANGLNVVQAMSFGVPVLAAEGDPQSGPETEAVIPGETGALFSHGDLDDLIDKLQRLILKRVELPGLGERALELVSRNYSAEGQASRMAQAVMESTSR